MKEKKKIIIINKSMDTGGIQRALLNLLNEIHDKYNITLYLFYCGGQYFDSIPNNVEVVTGNVFIQVFGMSHETAKKNIWTRIVRLVFAGWTKLFKDNIIPLKIAIYLQKSIGSYDVAITFCQDARKWQMYTGCNMFTLTKVKAHKKYAFNHADYLDSGIATKRTESIYMKYDKIFCDSKIGMEKMLKGAPCLKGRIDYLYNIQPVDEIFEKAKEQVISFEKDVLNILTVSRLSMEKGHIRALKILKQLYEEGYRFIWHIIGDGVCYQEIRSEIERLSLKDSVVLYGNISNPYPYFRAADIFFLPSYYESAPMTIFESLILQTPVISTKITSSNEFLHPDYSIIVENSEQGLYEGLKRILMEPGIINMLKENLKKYLFNNQTILNKLDGYINE